MFKLIIATHSSSCCLWI